ncbi:MAG: hypothetical protein HOP11_13445 [Saprospiraceae bacterium]|nr:hypothetical protein [Saprospiraceae bacterium]
MDKKVQQLEKSPSQLIYKLDLLDHSDHHPPHGHDDDNCCGSCKNLGKCSGKGESKTNGGVDLENLIDKLD